MLSLLTRIDRILPARYHIKRYPLYKYIPLKKAAEMIRCHPAHLITLLCRSPTAHALMFNTEDTIIVHPDGLMKLMKSKYKALIRRELRNTDKLRRAFF